MRLLQEFKAFALKGSIFDLAVGVVIGGAFGRMVSSFVNDIIMPPFGFILQGIDFKDARWVLKRSADGLTVASINYGSFFQSFIEFLIIGFAIFLLIKFVMRIRTTVLKDTAGADLILAEDTRLLREIRDLLKYRVGS